MAEACQHSPGYTGAVLPSALHTSLNFSGAKCNLFDTNPYLPGASPPSPLALVPLTRKYFTKRTLEVLKVPMVSISITVLKALKDRALAGHRKFPAAPEEQAAGGTVRRDQAGSGHFCERNGEQYRLGRLKTALVRG